jgi:hypothetical protein
MRVTHDQSEYALRLSHRTPIKLKILAEVKNEILYEGHFPTFDGDHSYAAVFTYSPLSVCEMDVPMNSNDIGSGECKDVPHADVLNIKMDSRELLEELPEPTFDGTLSPKSAARGYLSRVDKHPVIPPRRHELW